MLAAGSTALVMTFTSACSHDSTDQQPTESSPSTSIPTASTPEVKLPTAALESLMLARTDYPEGNGKFLVQDKAAIQKDDAERPDPVVTPAICADVVNEDKKNDKLDEARTKYSTETLDADSTVALGTDGSFAKAEEGAKKCPAVTFEMSGITVNAAVTFADVPGAAVEAKKLVLVGHATAAGQQVPIQSSILGAFPRGTSVKVSVTRTAEPWTAEDDALALALLNKQIAKVQEAP
ncbi:hypothetical protein MASS_0305 [Mycobacteroides abscessus subsp. bolletii 50594]|uniref:Lipoprotein LpqN n=2 Tax=Mycobacteroides abscessus TaxID=36809 RepID=A0AB33A596_9MYCO|nr:hypothetical protein MASS_0305 [Mycobacteroides abscessus subsp. bolletii 50594]